MGTLSFENKKFLFVANSDNENELARNARLISSGDNLRWFTRNAYKARKLRAFSDSSAENKFKKTFITDFKRPEQIVYPDHLSPKLFQIESAWHCVTRSPAYLADEAGLGKTITAIMCMNTIPGPTLIICPAYLKYNWEHELKKWCVGDRSINILGDGEDDLSNLSANITILPDSILTRDSTWSKLNSHNFTWLFVDEAHRYKESATKRTQVLLNQYIDLAKRVVFMSGTPVPNKNIELYPIISKAAPEVIKHMSELDYGKKFCAGKQTVVHRGKRFDLHWDFSGSSNNDILRKWLRKKFMIRHLKKKVLKELPNKIRQIVFLDKPKGIEKYEKTVLRHHELSTLLDEENYNLGDISTYRKQVGLSKVKEASSFIIDVLSTSLQPLIIFAHHIEVVDRLSESLRKFNPIIIRGGLTAREKNVLTREFQDGTKPRPLIGNIDAMGTGLTLTRAKRIIFVEYSWVSGINEQAEDRAHRITQENDVSITYLVQRNSLDERQLRGVLKKQIGITELMS